MKNNDIDNLYSRQELFAPFGKAGQQKLASSRIVIVGAGGLGSWVSELLARAGVGYIRLIDDDRVDYSNLPRQAMYTRQNAANGELKVTAAYQRLTEINPDIVLEPLDARVETDTAYALLSAFDVIIDATDSWESRFIINDFAVQKNIKWVFAGVVQSQGQIMPIIPGQTACLRCIFESAPQSDVEQANKASAVGVLGPAVSAIASLEALAAIKLLCDDDPPADLTHFDLWKLTSHSINTQKPSPACICCGKRKDIQQ